MNSKWWIGLGLLLVVAVGAGAAWLIVHEREDPQVARVQQIQHDLLETGARDNGSQTAAERRESAEQTQELFQQMREEVEQLDEEQRREVMQGFRQQMLERMRDTIDEYHGLPPEEQTAFLDREINRVEERRATLGGQGRGGGDSSRNAGSGDTSGGASDRPRPTNDQRQQFRRERLADTTPEERASFTAYVEAFNRRREERGLDPVRPFAGR